MKAEEGHAGVVALQPDGIARAGKMEAEAVPPRLVRPVAARAHHLSECVNGYDPSGEQCIPESAQVRRRCVSASVAAAPNRQVQDVRSQAITMEVAQRGAAGKLVAA